MKSTIVKKENVFKIGDIIVENDYSHSKNKKVGIVIESSERRLTCIVLLSDTSADHGLHFVIAPNECDLFKESLLISND